MSEENEAVAVITCQANLSSTQLQVAQIQTSQATLASTQLQAAQIQTNPDQMQAVSASQQAIVPQASPQQVQQQGLSQNNMAQVMSQGPQTAPSPHGVPNSMPPQSPQQYYVHTSVGTGMQGPPAIAPAPGPQTTTTTTVSALHQPLMHHLAPQPLTHPGVSPSPMPQFSPQVQVIQGGIPGAPYLQQVYQNAQGQLIMPSNLTIQPATGMSATPIQQSTLNPINSSIQVIAAGKPFQGQIAPHMIGGKTGVLQQGQTGYNHSTIPTSVGQTVLIGQLGGQLGVISSSQPPNILPAHSSAPKPGDVHKVNNMQAATFGPLQPGITWATPGTLHSPTLLTQNQPIFIRGTQPGQENVFIQSAQAQPMAPANSMVPSIASMTTGPQQAKARSGLEVQANIQPKVPSMRPPILPSMSGGQIRPGSSVSTQTAAGHPIAPAQMVTPRSQVQKYFSKVRGKNANSRASPATGPPQQPQPPPPQQPCPQHAQPQQQQPLPTQQPQQLQPQSHPQQGTQGAVVIQQGGATPISITVAPSNLVGAAITSASATQVIPIAPASTTVAAVATPQPPPQHKVVATQPTPIEAITSLTQNKQMAPMTPPTAPIQPSPHLPTGVRMPLTKGAVATTASAPTPTTATVAPATSAILAAPTPAMPLDAAQSTSFRPPTSLVSSTTTAPSTTFPLTVPGDVSAPVVTVPSKPAPTLLVPASTAPVEGSEGVAGDHSRVKCEAPIESPSVKAAVLTTPTSPHPSPVHHPTPGPTATAVNLPAPEAAPLDSNHSPMTVVPPTQSSGDLKEEKLPNGNCQPSEKTTTPPSSGHGNTGPPKAMVKPQVLTHVIEGFVIHEASEPFPVNRSSILNDLNKSRSSNLNNTATVLPQGTHVPSDKESLSEEEAKKEQNKDIARCEVCGKTDLRSKYKKSKRFCSNSCARRFNVGCSKRINLYKSSEESPLKKLKEGVESESEFEKKDPAQEEMEVDAQSKNFDGMVSDDEVIKTPKVDILKWTVRDVVEFIKNVPGCQDYAEDFELQEIDGQALMLLKADHLMSAMSMKLGPALKICDRIEAMRMDRKEN